MAEIERISSRIPIEKLFDLLVLLIESFIDLNYISLQFLDNQGVGVDDVSIGFLIIR